MMSVVRSALSLRFARLTYSLLVFALVALLLPVAARAQTITAGGAINFTASDSSAQSSTVTVSGAPGPVATVQVELLGVHSNGTGNYLSMAYAEFMLQSPTGEQFVLLGQTGDGTDNGGLNGQDIILVNSGTPAPNSTSVDTPWPTASTQTVEAGSYYYANGDGPPPLPTTEDTADYPQTDGSQTLNGKFSGVSANGTWTLYLIDTNSPVDPVSITGWTLSLTYSSATPTTTVLSSSTTNPAFYANSASSVSITYTATVSSGSGTPTGTVTFSANGSTISGCNAVTLSGGVAHCTVSLAQGNNSITAQYTPTGAFGQSSSSITQLVEVTPANPSGDQWCNNSLVSVPANDNPGLVYPSIIGIPNGTYSQSVSNVTVELEGIQGLTDGITGQFLLVAPGGTKNLVFLQEGWNDTAPTSAVNLTFDDSASLTVPYNSGTPTTGTYLPTDNNEAPNPDSFPTSTSPTVDSSVPQVPGTLNFAPPYGSDNAVYTHTNVLTFGEAFDGAPANGKWALYTYGPYAMNLNSGWCITLSLNSGTATTTTLTPGNNPSTTGSSLTFTATVTDVNGPVTSGGTVTFLDNGVAPAGTVGGNNVVALNGSGVAKFTTSSLTEGDHSITANYSGNSTDNESFSAVLHQRINTTTTVASVNSNTWSYCDPGAVQIQGGTLAGPLTPNPSVISVANLPGTLNTVSVTLNGFSVLTTYGLEELASLVEGPTGAALDFFSNTTQGANGNGEASLGAYSFADSGPGLVSAGNTSITPGTYKPTAYINYLSTPDVFTSSSSGLYNVPSFSYAPSLGTSTFADIFTNGSNANGTWNLFFSSGNANATFGAANGWCVNLTENLPTLAQPTLAHVGTFTQGEQNAAYTVNITNNGPGTTGDPAGGHPLTVTDSLNSAFTFASGSGTGWSCSASGQTVTCTNDSTIADGGSYSALTIDVDVADGATGTITNSVSVSGGGANSATSNTDSVTIQPAPALSVTKSHTGTFTQGSTAQWNITVSNTAAASSETSGTVTVSDTLPSGYSANNFGSTSVAWSCSGATTVTCTSTAGISGGNSFPQIQVIVNVPAASPVSVSNTALAYGGGDLTHTNSGNAAAGSDSNVPVVQVPASITPNTGTTPQSAQISTAFGTSLSVTVEDANSVPINNASVTFTAPGTGASGIFSNSSGTITETTNSSGIANAGTFTANATPGAYSVTASVSGLGTTATFSLTNSGVAPAITNANNTTFTVGTAGSFTVTTSGTPTAALSKSGALPSGVAFTDNGNGTATLSGTPAAGTGGSYPITITAANGVSPNATQNFTLTVNQAPAITSAASATFTAGASGSFTVTIASGTYPTASFSESGALPSGVSLSTSGVLSGTPAAGTGGSYTIIITASNGVGSNATQNFTLTVDQAPAITSADNASFTSGIAGSFTVTATGVPTPTLSESDILPSGVSFTDNGNGTATLAVTTAAAVGVYTLSIAAGNGISPNAIQSFTLTINSPASYVVSTTADDASGIASNCPVGGGGTVCSLRDALAASNTAGGIITFSSAVFSVSNTAAENTITLGYGTLDIPPNTTITGPTTGSGATLVNLVTVSGANAYQIFQVSSGVASIANLNIENGAGSGGVGGAIENSGGLTLTGCLVSGNTADGDPGISQGGGIANGGTLTVTNSTISGNTVSSTGTGGYDRGGGIFNTGALTVSNSTISGNTASTDTGGDAYGGGIYNESGTLTVTNSTFSGNTASSTGTGSAAQGGGIYNAGTMTVTSSTFSGNTASSGQGFYNDGQITIANTLSADLVANPSNNVISDGGNVIAGWSGVLASSINLTSLGNYGGSTQTLLPLPGSAAICAGTASPSGGLSLASTDQRGFGFLSTYCPSGDVDSGAVQTNYAMSFTTEPGASQIVGVPFTVAVTVTESGAPVSGVTIPLTLNGGGTLSGGSAFTLPSGVATYTLTVTGTPPLSGLSLTATLPSPPTLTATSSGFALSAPAPTVTTISPSSDFTTGGTTVTITGTNFTGATAVDFGSTLATNVTVTNSTTITATSPAGVVGTVDVTVTTPGGTSATTSADQFTYIAPTATSLTPTVTPSSTFVYSQQPSISVALAPSNAAGINVSDFTATLDSSTTLTVTAGTGNNFNIALPATPLTVGAHSIAINFIGATGYAASSATIALTVTTPNLVVTTNQDDAGTASNCTAQTTPGTGTDTSCSLRDALLLAAGAGSGNITFDSTAFAASNTASQNTITLSNGTLNIPANTSITGATSGSGATLTNLVTVAGVGSSSNFSVFTVGSGVAGAAINNLTIADGYTSGSGGGIKSSGSLTVSGSTLSGNFAEGNGGGIDSFGTLTVVGSTFSGNTSNSDGGGIVSSGTLTVSNSTFYGNSVPSAGGGIYILSGTATITDSTFYGNSTALGGGGGIDAQGTVTANNNIFTGNSANIAGGGIYQAGGAVTASYNVFYNNNGGDCTNCAANNNAISADPKLAALGSNGGPTQTMMPLPGSAAICAGTVANATAAGLTTDQRGFGFDPNCLANTVDSGAVQTNYAMSFTTEPGASQVTGVPFTAAVTLTESGAPFGGVAIPVTLNGSGTLTGSPVSETTNSNGVATYSLTVTGTPPLSGLSLTATLPSPPALTATSSSFALSAPAPTVTSVSPTNGFTAGGTTVTITGTNFTGATVVDFGTTPATNVTVVSSTEITATSPAGVGTVDVTVTTPGGTSATSPADQFTYTKATATVTLGSLSQTYTGSALSATATTTPVGLTVTFTYNGSAVTPTAAGSYTVVGTISDPNYQGSATGTLTINQASATINVTPYTVTYDGTAHTATGTATGVGGVNLAADLTLTGTTHTSAGTYAADSWSFTDPAGNYANASGTVSDKINQASATINVTPYTVTYDGTAHTATGTATGVGGVNLAADLTLTGTTHTSAGTYASDGWSFTDPAGNYANASGTVSDKINQASATINVTPYTVTYDGTAHTALGTATGVGGANLAADLTLTGTTHTSAGTYAADSWSFTDSAGNYASTSSTVSDKINQANATINVTPYTVTYDGNAHTATATTTPTGLTVTFSYTGTGGTTYGPSSTAPTAAGTYTVIGTVSDPNYQGTATGTMTISKATATVTLGGLSQTYTGSALSATATTTPANLTVTFTYNGSAVAPTAAGSYTVVCTVSDPNYQGTATGTMTISKATATVTLGELSQTYTGSALSATATTTPANLTVTFTYNGVATPPTTAGSYTVVGTVSDPNYQGSATGTLTIAKATVAVTLGNLSQTYTGSALSATATTTPANLTVTFTYNGVATPPTTAGSYTVVGTVSDPNYQGSATGTLTIAKATVAVTLGNLSQTYPGSALSATATTTPAGLTVTFTYNGSATPPTTAGSYTVVATVSDPNYQGSATGTLTISKGTATVTLGSLSQTYTGSALSATATTTPANLTVTFTYNGSAVAPTAAGTYTVVGTVSDPNYQGTATGTLTINKATPTVTWATPAAITYGTALNATQLDASSPVAGTFAYSPATGTVLAAGSQELSVQFTPTDATDYTAATASVTLTVNVQTQTISLASSTLAYASGVPFGVPPLTLSATSTSGLSVTFTLLSGPATLSGNSLTVNGAGTVAIAANQAGNANYAPAPQVIENVPVNKALPIASIASSANPVLLQNAITLSATIASGAGTPTGTVTFLDGSTPLGTGTLSGGVATLTTSSLADGTHSITATYGGDTNFLATTSSPLTQLVEDFNFNISSTSNNSSSSITVMPGGTAVFTFTVSPIDGGTFPAALTLTLSGLPEGATYSFSPATIAAGAGATVVTLTIDVPQTKASAKPLTLHPGTQLAMNRNGGTSGGQAGRVAGRLAPFSLALLLLPFAGRLRRTGKRLGRMMCALLLLAAGIAAVAGMSGCGSTSGFFAQQEQSYTVTLTATSGALSHSATVTLTVE